jgi:hypothetical protein
MRLLISGSWYDDMIANRGIIDSIEALGECAARVEAGEAVDETPPGA